MQNPLSKSLAGQGPHARPYLVPACCATSPWNARRFSGLLGGSGQFWKLFRKFSSRRCVSMSCFAFLAFLRFRCRLTLVSLRFRWFASCFYKAAINFPICTNQNLKLVFPFSGPPKEQQLRTRMRQPLVVVISGGMRPRRQTARLLSS